MNVKDQIKEYISSQPEAKQSDLLELHRIIQKAMPKCKLWFLDGKDANDKIVSNPNIRYGLQTINMPTEKQESFIKLV